MSVHEQKLIAFKVDPAVVGDSWPLALVKMIEEHELLNRMLVTRKQVHVLIDRYVERYFSGLEVSYFNRGLIIRTLRNRYYYRFERYCKLKRRQWEWENARSEPGAQN